MVPSATDAEDDDARLFRAAIGADRGEVRRLTPTSAAPAVPRPSPAAHMAQRDERDARDALHRLVAAPDDPNAGIGYLRAGLPAATLERLARGEFAVQAELDLRGLPERHARRELSGFLHACRRRGLGCVALLCDDDPVADGHAAAPGSSIRNALRHHGQVLAFHPRPEGAHRLLLRVLLAPRRR